MHMTTAESTQLRQRPSDDKQLRFPDACIANTNLQDLVLAAVRQIDPRLIPVPAAGAGIACQPRVLLGLLTCCYASGVFSSQEIEARVRKDPILNTLCGPRSSSGPEGSEPMLSAARSCDAVDREQCSKDASERIRWAINLDHM